MLFPTAAADLLFSTSRPVLSAFAMEVELNLGKLKRQGIVRFGQSVEADVMTSGEMRRSHRLFLDKRARDQRNALHRSKLLELRQQILEGDLLIMRALLPQW